MALAVGRSVRVPDAHERGLIAWFARIVEDNQCPGVDPAVPWRSKRQADPALGIAKLEDQLIEGTDVSSLHAGSLFVPERVAGPGTLPVVGQCHWFPLFRLHPGRWTFPGRIPNISSR